MSKFECQLNTSNFVTMRVFMRGSLTDKGPPMAQVCPPQCWGHVYSGMCDSSSESDSPFQVSRCSFFLYVIACAHTNTGLTEALGHRQVQVPPKQTLCTISLDVCLCVCGCMTMYICLAEERVTNVLTLDALYAHHLHWRIMLPRYVKVCFCANSQLALYLVIALDPTDNKFWHLCPFSSLSSWEHSGIMGCPELRATFKEVD